MDEYDSTNRYCDKTLPQLKDILRERNLKVTGKKKDLIERLLFHDRNAQIQEPVPEFHMSLPEAILYKDLHNDHLQNFPNVTRRRLLDFLASCDKSFDDKIEMLYQQRYLRCVRVATKDGNTFITSVVWAEMKKATTYKVDLSLDSHGVVLETQCECAVGQGPSAHCKHIICVLYGLTKYCTDGSILTEVTCTQVLQTFHRSKPQKGSPLKSKHLSQARGKTKPILYDPRPINKRSAAKAEQMLRSTVLNWQGKSKWPVLQKYASANLRALVSDHDYMELTWEEHFLKEEKISSITSGDISEIEMKTRGQSKSSDWIQERRKRLTASNFGTVCKATERRDIQGLLRLLITGTDISSKQMAHGRRYESIAVEEFERVTETKTTECGLFVSASHPMLAASPDRIIDNRTLIEIKCPYSARDEFISERTVPYLTSIDGVLTLKKTHNYYYQVQGQLFCTDRKLCKFIVYTKKDMKIIDICIDVEFVKEMTTKLLVFFNTHLTCLRQAILDKLMYKL